MARGRKPENTVATIMPIADMPALPHAAWEWLREQLHPDAPGAVVRLPSRSENRAYRVEAGAGVYTLKLTPPGRAHALAHEAAITDFLHEQGFPVPRTRATGTAPGLRETLTLRDHLPGLPLAAAYTAGDAATRAALAEVMGATLARIHTLPLGAVRGIWQYPEDTVTAPHEWATNFVQKKIAGDLDRIAPALPDDLRTAFVAELTAWGQWLATRPVPLAPLHGDLYGDNLLLHAGAISAILDWEAARLGDPLWDVARSQVAAFAGAEDGADDAVGFAAFRAAYATATPWPPDDARILRYRLLMAMGDLRYAVRHAPHLTAERVPPVLVLWRQCVAAE